ncbi:uncharacterized protein LOC128997287 [Macrosteles quadrilineatus]|uniref:uncharacterized protein LOC128997287 n=1 Tax=Macrosteles quadrilineatus TaxID=74068 RepID=UPI0023E1F1BF|nr:uncharacterized protein LOC128997287 [Macrosteles quadrilineatus]XP_054278892.1 uncharacterized protein LOC128997287 [Macrosteles quadrilineatus]
MAESKTPTIEQKSTFSAKTKEGADVNYIATIKYYVNPSGDVKITTPGSKTPRIPDPTRTEPKEETKKETTETGPKVKVEAGEGSKSDKVVSKPITEGKVKPNVDREVQQQEGICRFKEFVPDPCRAMSDLTTAIKDFFSCSSKKPVPDSGDSNHTNPPTTTRTDHPPEKHEDKVNEEAVKTKDEA